jgi:hypothetical protein
VTVGETLTEARYHAGLSVEELSERTRIRGTVIRSIEQDDFEACGGDLYVRGYVRAIAGAVGIDAQPLIREFDLGRSGGWNGSNGLNGRSAVGYPSVAPPPPATSFDLPAIRETPPAQEAPSARETPPTQEVPSAQSAPSAQEVPFPQEVPPVQEPAQGAPPSPVDADLNATRYDMPAVAADPATTSYDLPRVSATSFDLPRVPDAATSYAPTSYDLPRVPDYAPPAELVDFPAAEYQTAEFPPASPIPAPIPPAAVPPGTADTQYDIPAVRADVAPARPGSPAALVDFSGTPDFPAAPGDFPAAPGDLGPVSANGETRIIPAVGFAAPPAATTAWPVPGESGPGQSGPGPTGPGSDDAARKKRRGILAVAAAVVLVAAGLGIFFATAGGSTASKSTAATAAPSGHASTAAAKPSAVVAAPPSTSAPATPSASVSASASAKPAPAVQRVTSLPVASVMAFGPAGPADGDDPGGAGNVIAANPAQTWATQWYATATFGDLKPGTGLLLNMGGDVTVTTVRIDLSQYPGASLQLRVGNGEAVADLQRVAATANSVSGTLNLTLSHPVAARYLLIWITQLPLDGAGHYEETISHVAVTGHR